MGNALFMMVFCGTVLLAVTQLFLQQLMVFFGSSREVLGYASVYTRIVSIGFPFVIVATGGGHLLRADGRPKLTMLCNLDRKSTRLNSSHPPESRMPSSA